ncbi:MAG: hypothetical protein U0795_03400 [Pirellulales bacterium]
MKFSLRSLFAIVTGVALVLAVGVVLTLTWRRQIAIRDDLKKHGAAWVGFASSEGQLIPNVLYQNLVEDDFLQYKRVGAVELKCFDVTPQCIDRLSKLEHIDSLRIISCDLCDEDLVHLPKMNVTNLLFWNADITDSIVDTLAQTRGLKRITLVSTKITRQGIDRLQAALPAVKIVSRP